MLVGLGLGLGSGLGGLFPRRRGEAMAGLLPSEYSIQHVLQLPATARERCKAEGRLHSIPIPGYTASPSPSPSPSPSQATQCCAGASCSAACCMFVVTYVALYCAVMWAILCTLPGHVVVHSMLRYTCGKPCSAVWYAVCCGIPVVSHEQVSGAFQRRAPPATPFTFTYLPPRTPSRLGPLCCMTPLAPAPSIDLAGPP